MKATMLKKIWSQPQIEELGIDQTLGGFLPTTKETFTTIFGNINNFGTIPGCASGPFAKCK
jgi:hypothetical protein